MRSVCLAALCALAVAGCATIVTGTEQTVAVSTPGVSGATCKLTSPSVGEHTVVTPATLTLKKGKEAVSVRCSKECYIDGVGLIASNYQHMVEGNVVSGGLIGLGVDAASGAINEYSPEVQVTLVPDPKCKKPEDPKRKQLLSMRDRSSGDDPPRPAIRMPPKPPKAVSKREKAPVEVKAPAEAKPPVEQSAAIAEKSTAELKPPEPVKPPEEINPPVASDPMAKSDAEKLIEWGKKNVRQD